MKESKQFQLWLSIEVKDDEAMSKKEWYEWLESQRVALSNHIAKCLLVQKVKVNLGHVELK